MKRTVIGIKYGESFYQAMGFGTTDDFLDPRK
jgi:hypothetical protein